MLDSDPMLYRISQPHDWEQAQQTGFFASPDLAAEGFIHASELDQVLETARLYYAGSPGALLLEIDETTLMAASVRVEREWAAGRQAWFPHLFGPVPLVAVRRAWPLPVAADGAAVLPPELMLR
ncbi:DUF952 domain-containing protein [Hymenobacter psychrophilus]|uniref:Uncharacterized conserved protein, DUF952 family n=1 Tax=Hymenobacter psychrophilus TaxID=651662 RepID=A0A1H3BCG4_9BACT|nr:DUF952 domain-containing protein [Hymenobacter psychrophilus]SDX39622.1 Uncharacterized conserved protein, DUF952 family [Hymenobacter psychrophilus]